MIQKAFALCVIAGLTSTSLLADSPPSLPPIQDAAKPCVSSLNGIYGFVASGIVPSGTAAGQFVPIQEIGEAVYHPDLTVSARIAAVIDGSQSAKTFKGTYRIDSRSCAGTVDITDATSGLQIHLSFLAVSGQTELETLDTRGSPGHLSAIAFAQKKL
jgi:hypothetical protein